MIRAKVLGATVLAAGLAVAPDSAAAQAEVGAQVDLFSAYVWRGLSLTNKPVVEPSVYLSFPAGTASVTVGGWANIDIGEYDDPADDISESGGVGSFNLAEFDPYAEVSVPAGKATLTGGITGYIYPNDFGLTDDFNTWEIYGKVGFEEVPLAPELAVYYDIDKIEGAYIQASVAHSVPLNETLSLDLGALAGVSAGQHADLDDAGIPQAEFYNFAENGLTHIDLSAGLPLTAGVFSITPVVHFQISSDEATKVNSPSNDDEDFKLWGGVSIGWSKTLGEEAAAEE
ncbi:MAG TPA: TorF family putative porin [Gemmatimonadales bacterium]|nr:TorF family putative porin [Gemmatimonadales bacterium]